MGRIARRIGVVVAILIAGFVGLVLATARSGDATPYPPAAGERTFEILLVSHGYHAGIVLPRAGLAEVAGVRDKQALIATAASFAAYPWIEIGWGDEGFYRNVPTAASLTVSLAVRALLWPGNRTVLHLVGLRSDPLVVLPFATIVRLELSASGFERLLDRLDATFAPAPDGSALDDLGPGLYGPSRFVRATGSFHLFRVCNHWVADLLDAAGVPTTPVLATLPSGLLLDLRLRSGLVPLRRPGG